MPDLKLTHEQYNDAKTWAIYDNTEWNNGDNPAIVDVTSVIIEIGYQSTTKIVSSSSLDYYLSDNIKVSFLGAGDPLLIEPEDFNLEGTLEDGIYTLKYNIIYSEIDYHQEFVFVLDGNIRRELYKDTSRLNYKQLIEENLPDYSELEDVFVNDAFFESIFRQAYVAKDEEILAMMANLERRLDLKQ